MAQRRLIQDFHYPGHEEPTARWVLGRDAGGGRDYLVHLAMPRFVAKVGEDEDDGLLASFAYALQDGRSLYDFVWLDEPPTSTRLLKLLEAAEDVLHGQD